MVEHLVEAAVAVESETMGSWAEIQEVEEAGEVEVDQFQSRQ